MKKSSKHERDHDRERKRAASEIARAAAPRDEGDEALEARLAHGRSRVSNAARRGDLASFNRVDRRTPIARRFRDLVSLVTSDIGGPDRTSECQRQIIRRIASLSVWCESQEAEMADGREIDILRFGRTANSLRRLCEAIGFERRSRDITPTLAEYLAASECEDAELEEVT